jgi:hypothetical protein
MGFGRRLAGNTSPETPLLQNPPVMQLLSGDDVGPHSFVCSRCAGNVTVGARQPQQPRTNDGFLTRYLRRRVAAKRRGSAGLWRSGQCDSYCAPPTATAQPQGFPRLSCLRHARFRSAVAFLPPMTSRARQNLRASQQNAFSDAPTRAHRRRDGAGGKLSELCSGVCWSLPANATQFVVHPVVHVEEELSDRVRKAFHVACRHFGGEIFNTGHGIGVRALAAEQFSQCA